MTESALEWHLNELRHALPEEYLALMLFGSVARGQAGQNSDTDILMLSKAFRPSFKHQNYSITVYTPNSLQAAAVSGSLFVLHLISEGITIKDNESILEHCLSMYIAPDNYNYFYEELKTSINLLNVSIGFYASNWERCHQLALFILRSTLYARAAERGNPTFSMFQIAQDEHDDRIIDTHTLKYATHASVMRFQCCIAIIMEYLQVSFLFNSDSIEEVLMYASAQKSRLTISLAKRLLGLTPGSNYGRLPESEFSSEKI